MRPADLLDRTSVRLALGFALLLIAAFALAGGIAWLLIREQLVAHENQRILQTWEAIAAEVADGRDEVVAAVEEQLGTVRDRSTLILLRDASGQMLAGNVQSFLGPAGWSNQPAQALGLQDGRRYRVYDAALGGDDLTVGSDRADLHEVGEIVLGALAWGSVAMLVLALSGGAFIAAGVQVRMEAMEATLDKVAAGDLTARLPDHGQSDLARLGRGINAALARLEGMVEGMRQVSTDIAHDLRTPLARLRMRIEGAAALAHEASPLKRDLEIALEDSDRIDSAFSALLRIAQIEAGARRAQFMLLDLGDVMERLVEAYEGVAEDAGQTLALAVSDVAPVQGDRDLLLQLFANLVENAIRHGPPGTRIECAVIHEGGRTTATVRDTGPGIPADEHDKVLRRLYRLEKSRTSPGTGLGLALVKAVADLHDAALDLSDASPGLRVSVRFPPSVARA